MVKKAAKASIDAADLAEYLATQDDFSLELSIYNEARSLGWTVTHGGTYDDPVTGKPRQYDIRAYQTRDSGLQIAMAIECKSLKRSFPLLISRIPRAEHESFHDLIWARRPEHPYPDPHGGRTIRVKGDASFFRTGELVGKSTAQVGRNEGGEFVRGDGEVYDKWSQALSSAEGLIGEAKTAYNRCGIRRVVTWVLPVLVVADDTLWVADYVEDGRLIAEPKQVDSVSLFVGRKSAMMTHTECTFSHLLVRTRRGIHELLDTIASKHLYWHTPFPASEIARLDNEA